MSEEGTEEFVVVADGFYDVQEVLSIGSRLVGNENAHIATFESQSWYPVLNDEPEWEGNCVNSGLEMLAWKEKEQFGVLVYVLNKLCDVFVKVCCEGIPPKDNTTKEPEALFAGFTQFIYLLLT